MCACRLLFVCVFSVSVFVRVMFMYFSTACVYSLSMLIWYKFRELCQLPGTNADCRVLCRVAEFYAELPSFMPSKNSRAKNNGAFGVFLSYVSKKFMTPFR